METYSEYKQLKAAQNIIVDELSDKLNSFEKYNNGMVIESVRLSDNFKKINSKYLKEFKKLQEINKQGMRLFKKDIRKEYEDRRKLTINK